MFRKVMNEITFQKMWGSYRLSFIFEEILTFLSQLTDIETDTLKLIEFYKSGIGDYKMTVVGYCRKDRQIWTVFNSQFQFHIFTNDVNTFQGK